MRLETTVIIDGKLVVAGTELKDSEAEKLTNPALVGKAQAKRNAAAAAEAAGDAEAAQAAEAEAEQAEAAAVAAAEAEAAKPPTVKAIMEEVGEDVEKAKAALEAERKLDSPRPSLIAGLQKLIAEAESGG